MKYILFPVLLILQLSVTYAQHLPGFKISGCFNEQQMVIENSPEGTRILINAPLEGFDSTGRVTLIFYALPNGSTIEQTIGKNPGKGDDWRYNIQHIGAQVRFLRNIAGNQTIVVAYLETSQRSWPAWKASTPGYGEKTDTIINKVKEIFARWDPVIVLNGHSGGGRFIFSYIENVDEIPSDVARIAFLDSNYGYEDTIHGSKLVKWIRSGRNRHLCTLAYNDSVVIYNGKPLVSPTGGTWYRSRMMLNFLSKDFRFRKYPNDSMEYFRSRDNKIEFIFRKNPQGEIFHTLQVEKNGFIHSMLSGTHYDQKGYSYFGPGIYSEWIGDSIPVPVRRFNIPTASNERESGSSFIERIESLDINKREEEIFKAIASGNIPDFLRNTVTLKGNFHDSEGKVHSVVYEAMPDYLSVGTDDDYCRIPMNPRTAQRLAILFGASLLTSKLSDHIYKMAETKLKPFNYVPLGNANETVLKFREHNDQIENQLKEAGSKNGQLVAGIKKDIILSPEITARPDRVVVYGWHKPDSIPIQPVYSGHIWWYVDYSHGIRLVNNQVLVDGKPMLLTDILTDPVLYKIFSDDNYPLPVPMYPLSD